MQQNVVAEIRALEAEVGRALQAGRGDAAWSLWERILGRDPNHAAALMALGQRAYRGGDLATARRHFDHLTQVNGRDKQQWINLAVVCLGQQDEAGEEAAIRGALTLDATDLLGLILRANLLKRQGKTHAAASAFGAVAAVAPPLERLSPELRPAVIEAMAYRDGYNRQFGEHLDASLAPLLKDLQGEELGRFRESMDIMLGRKKRYDSQSAIFHYHGLAPVSFFKREDFPWLDPIEAATDVIREEFLGVLQAEEGFTPYLTYSKDQPLNQWAELNNSPRWSAFHLIKDGVLQEANAVQCPQTMALLGQAPQPGQPGRTPSAMFSLLKPQTHIPPHTGVSNVRLVTHLPLIIPAHCGFRVGNETRQWEPGKAWVFDDTIEHEAWNNSDLLRVVLIFDIWHPQLSLAERALVSAMSGAIGAFTGDAGSFAL